MCRVPFLQCAVWYKWHICLLTDPTQKACRVLGTFLLVRKLGQRKWGLLLNISIWGLWTKCVHIHVLAQGWPWYPSKATEYLSWDCMNQNVVSICTPWTGSGPEWMQSIWEQSPDRNSEVPGSVVPEAGCQVSKLKISFCGLTHLK